MIAGCHCPCPPPHGALASRLHSRVCARVHRSVRLAWAALSTDLPGYSPIHPLDQVALEIGLPIDQLAKLDGACAHGRVSRHTAGRGAVDLQHGLLCGPCPALPPPFLAGNRLTATTALHARPLPWPGSGSCDPPTAANENLHGPPEVVVQAMLSGDHRIYPGASGAHRP